MEPVKTVELLAYGFEIYERSPPSTLHILFRLAGGFCRLAGGFGNKDRDQAIGFILVFLVRRVCCDCYIPELLSLD